MHLMPAPDNGRASALESALACIKCTRMIPVLLQAGDRECTSSRPTWSGLGCLPGESARAVH